MKRYLIHWYYLSRATAYLAATYIRAAWVFRKYTANELGWPNNPKLTLQEFRRWKQYYYGTTYLSAIFCLLCGRRRSRLERQLFAKLAALACYFDDLTDNLQTDKLLPNPGTIDIETFAREADPGGRAMPYLNEIYSLLPDENLRLFKNVLHRIFEVEADDRQKSNPAMSLHKLADHTAEKGRYSVLLFRSLLAPELVFDERLALSSFGYLIQLCDDIFDLWFDRNQGINTLATIYARQGRIDLLHHAFERAVSMTIQQFRAVAFPRSNIETAIRAVYFLTGITRVCLKHYRRLQQISNDLPLNERSAMVVDMARWSNRWQAAVEILKPIP